MAAKFGVSIGFHSGSGKSAGNYRVMGEVTGGRLEIKTSGRYTYEMGRALSPFVQTPADRALWQDWYAFTADLAVAGAFSADPTERGWPAPSSRPRLPPQGCPGTCLRRGGPAAPRSPPFRPARTTCSSSSTTSSTCSRREGARRRRPWDHSPAGYAQRARFYAISPEARLLYSRGVAEYLIFLAENTGLVPAARCAAARSLLDGYPTLEAFLDDISR